MLQRILIKNYPLTLRYFSTGKKFESQWDNKNPYTPLRPITFTNGKYLVYQQSIKGVRQMPYELKEISIRNAIGVIVGEVASTMSYPFSIMSTLFVVNYVIQVFRKMNKAITEIELLEGGKEVMMKKKIGGKIRVAISDIKKLEDESKLMPTYAEPYLFPIEVSLKNMKKTFYIYGQGFEPIKNGEVFRAIINGKEVIDKVLQPVIV